MKVGKAELRWLAVLTELRRKDPRRFRSLMDAAKKYVDARDLVERKFPGFARRR